LEQLEQLVDDPKQVAQLESQVTQKTTVRLELSKVPVGQKHRPLNGSFPVGQIRQLKAVVLQVSQLLSQTWQMLLVLLELSKVPAGQVQ
jgi:hypothetical protein